MTDLNFILFGTHQPPAQARVLRAGTLSVDLQDGNLRTIRHNGHEVLRAIAFLVRDRDWGTCPAEISDLKMDETPDGFSVTYRAGFAAPDGARLIADIAIEGKDARIVFTADFTADGDFETARAGFTVLHPIVGVAGQPVRVTRGNGEIEDACWPEAIDPWQPFKDIAAITHQVGKGIEAETVFSGDVFEMEDQRNWTDGSFKTYVRPLALPWPYRLESGQRHRQSVELVVRADVAAPALVRDGQAVEVSISPAGDILLPDIGVGLRPDCMAKEKASLPVLDTLGVRHLIAHFDPTAGHGGDVLEHYARMQAQSGLPLTLECAVACARPLDTEFEALADLVASSGLTLDSLFVSPSVDRQSTPPGSQWPACPPLEDLYAAARKAFPGLRLGGGMLSYFTELNRKRVPGDLLDYISHCTNPIVHAADDLSVMQTFEALADVVASTRSIYGTRPYRIGPSTIAMRQNPYGSATKDNPALARIPMANVDPRHNGRFGAAWTLAYAATVAATGLEVLTLSTLAGTFGPIADDGEPVKSGDLRPLAHVIKALGSLSGQQLVTVSSTRRDCVLGLGGRDGEATTRLLLANITARSQSVSIGPAPRSVCCLGGETTQTEWTKAGRVSLDPFGCVLVTL